MSRIGGNPGNKGGGRYKEHDKKIRQFKGAAWDLIVKRSTTGPKKKREEWLDKYIPMFANRLIPQTIEGPGKDGAFVFKNITGMKILPDGTDFQNENSKTD